MKFFEKRRNGNKFGITILGIPFNFTIKTKRTPSEKMPEVYRDLFTLGGRIPVLDYYIDETFNFIRCKKFKMKSYNEVFDKLSKGVFPYYGKTINYIMDALRKYPIKGKSVCVFGSIAVNCDAISIFNGAESVVILEYNPVKSEHPKVRCMSYVEYENNGIKCDVGISVSSFEHDGLTRYGDPINPYGDLQTMQKVKNLIKKDGLLYLSVPVGPDAVCWTAHRIYGKIRLPMLLEGWKLLESFGFDESILEGEPSIHYVDQPVFVLKNI